MTGRNSSASVLLLDQHANKNWKDLPKSVRINAEILGYTEKLWDNDGDPPSSNLYWNQLTPLQQQAAKNLGYTTAQVWDNDEDGNTSSDDDENKDKDKDKDKALVLDIHKDESWQDLPTWIQTNAIKLGYTPNLWNQGKEPEITNWDWNELTKRQKHAAKILGYTQKLWDHEDNAKNHNSSAARTKSSTASSAATTEIPSYDVIIIGAGWAGIGAGLKLLKTTKKFRILEGRDEIGGRCRTMTMNDGKSIVELGAQWIQDSYQKQDNPIKHFAKKMNIDAKPMRDTGVLYASPKEQRSSFLKRNNNRNNNNASTSNNSGRLVEVSKKEYQKKYKELARAFLKYRSKRKTKVSVETSLEDILQEFLRHKQLSPTDEAWLRCFLDTEICQEYAASLDELSCKFFDSDNTNDAQWHLAQSLGGGYKALIDYAAKSLKANIQCSAKVTGIDWKQAGDNEDWISVHYHCGRSNQNFVIKARKVLLTVPLGVLKAKTIAFSPPLPLRKQYAIDNMGYGCLNKCILLWDDAQIDQLPWPKDKEWLSRLVMNNRNNNTTGNNASSKDTQGIWTEFFNLYPVNQRPMLMCFLAGKNAIAVEERYRDDEEIQRELMQTLRTWFGDSNIPEPKQIVVTRWHQDEFSFGSYSYSAAGMTPIFRDRLADPIEGKLYFAGEACHASYPSTTLGACLSGQTMGTRIAKDLRHASKSTKSSSREGCIVS